MAEQLAYNMDCLAAMRQMPDKAFDLAVVDPPYGGDGFHGREGSRFGGRFNKYYIGNQEVNIEIKAERTGRTWSKKYQHENPDNKGTEIKHWDVAPPPEYFEQLFRVSKNQIIWGGNYFDLPPTRCFLIWRKLTISDSFTMANVEYAWTSFNDNAKVFEYAPQDKTRFHPTQKPVDLYKWIYGKYAKAGDKILDTHLGSGSSRIAAYDMGFDFVGYEISKVYFKKQEARWEKHTSQVNLFLEEGI